MDPSMEKRKGFIEKEEFDLGIEGWIRVRVGFGILKVGFSNQKRLFGSSFGFKN